ncbi:hypothetical protein PM082_011546 [Marasmius tenuissimus]|nr:hypothetical protein PM082_011546 [Marasmius tenuissimus]
MVKQRKFRKISEAEVKRRTATIQSSQNIRFLLNHITPNGSQSTTKYYADPPPRTQTPHQHQHQYPLVDDAHPPITDSINTDAVDCNPIKDCTEREREELEKKEQTQRAKLLEQYGDRAEMALHILMSREANSKIGTPCQCGSHVRSVICRDCDQLPPLCPNCWIEQHRYQPLHWAHVWSTERGYFIRHDISSLLPGGYPIPLGHDGHRCPNPSAPLQMILVDTNGIHASLVTFCKCGTFFDKWRSLFELDFFPATVKDPQLVFTFRLLRDYQLKLLQSGITPFAYMKALRRQTDNVFTGNVPDPYKQFMFITRIWPYFEAEKRFGHLHGIDKVQTGRRPGNLIVYCPVCPDPTNMEPGWEKTPQNLRHLHQTHLTLDGNFQANHFAKNSDPNDVSLWGGRAYFPVDAVYKTHLQKAGSDFTTEKCLCGHTIKAIEKQNRVKFKNMDISGIVNCQCDHIFVWSSVDLQLGERFVNTDYALRLALGLRDFHQKNTASYDKIHLPADGAMCSFCKKIMDRWRKHHPEFVPIIEKMRWVIPACHCRNHVEGCDYLYSSAFKPCTGHFHAETAEYYWPNLNAIAGACRQMNPGRRHDAIIQNHGDWNWRKLVGIGLLLLRELVEAKKKYIQKRDHFIGLCEIYAHRLVEWNSLDRSPKVNPKNKRQVVSVYSHNNNDKVPSLNTLVDYMQHSPDILEIAESKVHVGKAAVFLKEGLALLQLQARVARIAAAGDPSNPTKELLSRREKLTKRMTKWRKDQKHLMPRIALYIAQQSPCSPEQEKLFVPSHFPADKRREYKLVALASRQVTLLEGALNDVIQALRMNVQILTAAYDRKKKNDVGQDANTRSTTNLKAIESKRDGFILDYNLLRNALNDLDALDPDIWPKMEVKDTFRKSTEQRRTPGDSQVEEGILWRMGVPELQQRVAEEDEEIFGNGDHDEMVCDVGGGLSYTGTQMNHRRGQAAVGPGKKKTKEVSKEETSSMTKEDKGKEKRGVTADGWIWCPRSTGKMNEEQIKHWADICDRVQWTRAEAAFERWQEQLERKHAEFMRCIASFASARDTWQTLSSEEYSSTPGHRAYAKEHSDMYETLRVDCETKYKACGIPILHNIPSGKTLSDQVALFREAENKYFTFDRSTRPAFRDPTCHATGFGDIREEETGGKRKRDGEESEEEEGET